MSKDAGPVHDYTNEIIYAEDELSIAGVTGTATKWIGGLHLLFEVKEGGEASLKCIDTWEFGYLSFFDVIFFEQDGDALQFDEVISNMSFGKHCLISQMNYPRCKPNAVVVRLKKKLNRSKISPSPLDIHNSSKVTFIVDETNFYFDKELLCQLSPIFHAMFNGPYKESAASAIELPNNEPQEIRAFLEAMLPCENRSPPNPSNVVPILLLADKYDVKTLVIECGRCLKHAHELPVIDRLVIADRLQLNDVKLHLATKMSRKDWSDVLNNDEAKIDMLSDDFTKALLKRFL